MLEIKNIKKTYHMSNHDVKALDDVSLNVAPGNLVAIVGPSGCGKTSLMNVLGAMDSDFEGDVIVNGKSLKDAQGKDIDTYRKNTVGFIFQHFTLINSLNAHDNISLAFDISNVDKNEKEKRTQELLSSVGLSEHAKKKVNVLSGGQKQRVAIARALANNPDIILADEPTGALDHRTGIQVMELLKEIAKDRIVIMVTHSPELAQQYANVIVSMEDGKIIKTEENIPVESKVEKRVEKDESKSNMGVLTAFRLALQNLKLKKGRTIWTSIGMSIGIVGIALAFALSNGTKTTVENQLNSIFPANMIMVTKDNGKKENDFSDKNNRLSYKDYQEILKQSKDVGVSYFSSDDIIPLIASPDKKTSDIEKYNKKMRQGKGIETPHTFVMMASFSKSYDGKLGFGKMPNQDNGYEILVSLSTAKSLIPEGGKVEDLVNKEIYISFMNTETEKNVIQKYKVTGITSENTLLSTLYFTQSWPKTMLKEYFDIDIKEVKSSAVVLTAGSKDNVKKTVADLNASQDKYKYEAAAQSILDTVNVILDGLRNGLIAFSSISVFVAILMISIVVYISVLERKQEIGIIRAIGGKMKDIRNMFLGESLVIGLLAGTIGVSIAVGICKIINSVMHNFLLKANPNTPPLNVASLDITTALLIIGACGLLAIISGLIPSIKAAKLDPIDAIRKK